MSDIYIFSYGTLGDEPIQVEIFGERIEPKPDSIQNFVVRDLIEESGIYPIAYHKKGQELRGNLLRVNAQQLENADEYEGPSYVRSLIDTKGGFQAWLYHAAE